ncbi:MAG: PIN domain-containing protein [Leptolyngbyaceae cyanobacterium RU_5_1]|nr:PIN domain-containing protein [Leptolyngbyaceae cyanobacterium RU_5_1]
MIISDTGFFVALGNQTDQDHPLALRLLDHLNEPLITTYPVITETCYLLLNRVNNTAQCAFLETISEGMIEVFELDFQCVRRMVTLMRRYNDLPMDMADASLVVLAEALGHGRVLTVDRRDFSIYRWNNQEVFENLFQR